MVIKELDILKALYDRLTVPFGSGITRGLIYGIGFGYGGIETPVAVTVINFTDEEAIKRASRSLPHGLSLMGVVEYDSDEDQDVYAALDHTEQPVLLKVKDEQIVASTGLDFLTPVRLNVLSEEEFWGRRFCTFRLKGQLLLTSLLEFPDLKDCFAQARVIVNNQAAYALGKDSSITILPSDGKFISEIPNAFKASGTVTDLVKFLKSEIDGNKEKTATYFSPGISIINVQILFDQTKSSSFNNAAVAIADKSACCKYFEHYADLDTLVVVPVKMLTQQLYENFNEAVCSQLEAGFHANIIQQLVNSISAEKPEVFHFWPSPGKHFVTALYPQNTSEEKLKDIRHDLHNLFFIREACPYFRRSASLFQPGIGLISPHVSLKGKFSETEIIKGHYEYRHYMQESFNDDGWGCAYRSLQTIVSWFRLQGFTSAAVPTHREIQECLVSLGDKPASFIGSKQWIGSTEVSFVLEALLGISCRIMTLSSGGEIASRVSELNSHFRTHGTPIMVGGGVLAHTMIGASCDSDSGSDINYLILDPHYTGKDDLKTILNKGGVGWKDNKFWSKKDFYNLCMPLCPQSI